MTVQVIGKHGVLFFMSLAFVGGPAVFAQGSRGANVPTELAKRAALHYANQFYGKATHWDLTPYYGLDGEIEVYAVVLYRGTAAPPTRAGVHATIGDARRGIEELNQQIIAVSMLDISGRQRAARLAELRKQLQAKRERCARPDDFLTVLAGAHEEHVPVIRVRWGLPEHMTRAPTARQLAVAAGATLGNQLVRTFYLGIFDLAFEFGSAPLHADVQDSAIDEDVLLVLAPSGQVVSIRELRAAAGQRKLDRQQGASGQREANEEAAKRTEVLRKKWARVKRLSGEPIELKEQPRQSKVGPDVPSAASDGNEAEKGTRDADDESARPASKP